LSEPGTSASVPGDEPVEGVAGGRGVTLAEALGRFAQRGRRCTAGLRRGALQPGEGACQVSLLGRSHRLDVASRLFDVLRRLLGVAFLVDVGLPLRGAREAAAERCQRRRALLVRRVYLCAQVPLDRAEAGEVGVEGGGIVAKLAGQLAKLPGELGAWVVDAGTLRLELLGDLVDPPGLLLRRVAKLALLGDRGVLGVRQEHCRDQKQAGKDRDECRSSGDPRLEHGRSGTHRGDGIVALSPDESLVDRRLAGVGALRFGPRLALRGTRQGGLRDRQLERGGHAIAQAGLSIDRERRVAD